MVRFSIWHFSRKSPAHMLILFLLSFCISCETTGGWRSSTDFLYAVDGRYWPRKVATLSNLDGENGISISAGNLNPVRSVELDRIRLSFNFDHIHADQRNGAEQTADITTNIFQHADTWINNNLPEQQFRYRIHLIFVEAGARVRYRFTDHSRDDNIDATFIVRKNVNGFVFGSNSSTYAIPHELHHLLNLGVRVIQFDDGRKKGNRDSDVIDVSQVYVEATASLFADCMLYKTAKMLPLSIYDGYGEVPAPLAVASDMGLQKLNRNELTVDDLIIVAKSRKPAHRYTPSDIAKTVRDTVIEELNGSAPVIRHGTTGGLKFERFCDAGTLRLGDFRKFMNEIANDGRDAVAFEPVTRETVASQLMELDRALGYVAKDN